MIACDIGSGGDIWFTRRSVEGLIDWYTRSAAWSATETISLSEGGIDPIITVSDINGNLHAMWAAAPSLFDSGKNIHYARWDGVGWNFNQIIIQPPFDTVNHLAAAMDHVSNTIYLVWSGGERGEIYFSHANADFAGNPSEWAAPIQLPMPASVGFGADIHVRTDGEIVVAYSVPVNERRGVYITSSIDAGRIWSSPVPIVDGISLGWEVVGSPKINLEIDGSMHLLVLRLPPLEGGSSTRLYYSRSTDEGLTWEPPSEIVSGDVGQISIGVQYSQTLYRYWQEYGSGGVTNFLQISTDNGASWSEANNFIGLDSLSPTSALAVDAGGALHIVQVAEGISGQLLLQEWIWDGISWQSEPLVEVDTGKLSELQAMAITIRSDGQMGVLYTKITETFDVPRTIMRYSERILDITIPDVPPVEPTLVPTPTPEPVELPTATPEVEEVLTEEPGLNLDEPAADGNLVLELLFGFVSAILVVLVAFLLINRFLRRR
jgi:hypothetical protein